MNADTKPSICIVAHNAYGVLANIDTGHAGGIEVQTPLMAKWLARQGFKVSMITWDEGYEDGTVIDGVSVYKLCRKDQGIPVLRFLTPRWSSLISALERANADVVYYNCGDLGLGQVVMWAKWRKRKVLYSVANDIDCQQSLPSMTVLRERLLYRYGLKRADKIVAQTETQKRLLQQEFGLEATVIRMPSAGFPEKEKTPAEDSGQSFRVLWVGRITKEKRVEWLLDVATDNPDIQFDVLGDANVSTAYSAQQFARGKQLPNVTMHGRVPHKEMDKYYHGADILCSTSIYEGFPNVYLEAWSVGLPLISTFDPDGVVAKYGHGKIVDSIGELSQALREFQKPEIKEKASQAAKSYFQNFHTVDRCMNQFREAFESMAKPL